MSTTEEKLDMRTLTVRGASLYLEVRGSGPVLLCISGAPTDAGIFSDLAAWLADRYTVVSYDQRGHSRSTRDGEPADIPVALHADDADIDALRNVSTRIVSAARETSGEQAACRAAVALAERFGINGTRLPGGHGGWGSDPRTFAERFHGVFQKA